MKKINRTITILFLFMIYLLFSLAIFFNIESFRLLFENKENINWFWIYKLISGVIFSIASFFKFQLDKRIYKEKMHLSNAKQKELLDNRLSALNFKINKTEMDDLMFDISEKTLIYFDLKISSFYLKWEITFISINLLIITVIYSFILSPYILLIILIIFIITLIITIIPYMNSKKIAKINNQQVQKRNDFFSKIRSMIKVQESFFWNSQKHKLIEEFNKENKLFYEWSFKTNLKKISLRWMSDSLVSLCKETIFFFIAILSIINPIIFILVFCIEKLFNQNEKIIENFSQY